MSRAGWQKFKQGASRFFKGAWNGLKKVGTTIWNGVKWVATNVLPVVGTVRRTLTG